MGLTSDEHRVEIGETTVVVKAATGAVHATWTLEIDGHEADRAAAAGDFRLRGHLPDGSPVAAEVHQSLMGPTRVTISHDGVVVHTAKGFVA